MLITTSKKGMSRYLQLKQEDKDLEIVYRQQQGAPEEYDSSEEEQVYDSKEKEEPEHNDRIIPETVKVQEIKQKIKRQIKEYRINKLRKKPFHEQIASEAINGTINQKTETKPLLTA
ncbi:hypothetical protein HHI36_001949 [Cryptolaemus montrouzieri]|uniref:Uncharacterized protein n=1 Tax=Cryptolaemus montrouzieri TaxID=559131 RepID=A0ABD2P938_9CUCU